MKLDGWLCCYDCYCVCVVKLILRFLPCPCTRQGARLDFAWCPFLCSPRRTGAQQLLALLRECKDERCWKRRLQRSMRRNVATTILGMKRCRCARVGCETCRYSQAAISAARSGRWNGSGEAMLSPRQRSDVTERCPWASRNVTVKKLMNWEVSPTLK